MLSSGGYLLSLLALSSISLVVRAEDPTFLVPSYDDEEFSILWTRGDTVTVSWSGNMSTPYAASLSVVWHKYWEIFDKDMPADGYVDDLKDEIDLRLNASYLWDINIDAATINEDNRFVLRMVWDDETGQEVMINSRSFIVALGDDSGSATNQTVTGTGTATATPTDGRITRAPSPTSTSASSTSDSTDSGDDSGLSTGAKAGIGVGVAIGVISLLAIAFLLIRRARTRKADATAGLTTSLMTETDGRPINKPPVWSEVPSSNQRHELYGDDGSRELPVRTQAKAPTQMQVQELQGTRPPVRDDPVSALGDGSGTGSSVTRDTPVSPMKGVI